MHTHARNLMIAMCAQPPKPKMRHATAAETVPAATMHELVAKAVEVGVVVPSILKSELDKAGYVVDYHKKKNGYVCTVQGKLGPLLAAGHRVAVDFHECHTRDPKAAKPKDDTLLVIGQAYSHDAADALLQAVFAEMKEEVKQ